MTEPLTPDEDAELRRLSALAEYGPLGPAAAALFAELRARDRRTEIRPPIDVVTALPRQRDDGPTVDAEDDDDDTTVAIAADAAPTVAPEAQPVR